MKVIPDVSLPLYHAQAVDKGGYQQELPDIWLTDGNPWEVKRSEIKYEICFGGKTEKKNGVTVWLPNQKVGRVVGRMCVWLPNQKVGLVVGNVGGHRV